MAAALPLKVFPPLFNRYQGGQSFGTHVDNAVRQITGTPHRVRTDISATLFLASPDEYDAASCRSKTFTDCTTSNCRGTFDSLPATSLHPFAARSRFSSKAAAPSSSIQSARGHSGHSAVRRCSDATVPKSE